MKVPSFMTLLHHPRIAIKKNFLMNYLTYLVQLSAPKIKFIAN